MKLPVDYVKIYSSFFVSTQTSADNILEGKQKSIILQVFHYSMLKTKSRFHTASFHTSIQISSISSEIQAEMDLNVENGQPYALKLCITSGEWLNAVDIKANW